MWDVASAMPQDSFKSAWLADPTLNHVVSYAVLYSFSFILIKNVTVRTKLHGIIVSSATFDFAAIEI